MSGKYTPGQLQSMAIQFNQYYSVGDPRAVFMIEMLAAVTNNTEQECLEKINKLAMGESL
jgi:hypothetical protein